MTGQAKAAKREQSGRPPTAWSPSATAPCPARRRDRLRRQERRVQRIRRRRRHGCRREPCRSPPPTRRRCRRKTVADTVAHLAARSAKSWSFPMRPATTADVVYLHRRATDLPPQVGVMVEYAGGDEDFGPHRRDADRRNAPQYVTRDDVPAELVQRASDRRADRARRGQARADLPEDRRGPGGLLLQGCRAAGPGLGGRRQEPSASCSPTPA